jgi:hypothetical protein
MSIAFCPIRFHDFVNLRVPDRSCRQSKSVHRYARLVHPAGVDASLHEVYSKTVAAEAAPAVPPAVKRL